MSAKSSTKENVLPTLLEELSDLLDALEAQADDDSDHSAVNLPKGYDGRFGKLAKAFKLSPFEQLVLAVALAQELLPVRTRKLVAQTLNMTEYQQLVNLTPLACMNWVDHADALAFADDRPLLSWGLLQTVEGLTPDSYMRGLIITPGVMMFIEGHDDLDPALSGIAQVIDSGCSLSQSQQDVLKKAQKYLDTDKKSKKSKSAQQIEQERGILFFSTDEEAMLSLSHHLLSQWGKVLHLDIAGLAAKDDKDRFASIQAYKRDLRLKDYQAVLNVAEPSLQGEQEAKGDAILTTLLNEAYGRVVVIANTAFPLKTSRALLPLEVYPPSPAEQRLHWATELNVSEHSPQLYQLGDQFHLNLDRISNLAHEVNIQSNQQDEESKESRAWQVARLANRRRMGALAQRIESSAFWEDLILPENDLNVLKQIARHVQHRAMVYEHYGMNHVGRGRAVTALFSGPSGTGKTLSAEILANELKLDLYRIDLSSTVSKYIGETEKNLKRIFDAADLGGCILLFDEADSVFGKRAEVKDSNDRYANIQVNYLLQRLESFNGLALLTTNMESSMDIAFMRRIQFVVNYRAPQPPERERIWRRAFPESADCSQLDFEKLSHAEVSGGNIRGIALNAMFLAVAEDSPLTQEIVDYALRLEYRKLGRLILD